MSQEIPSSQLWTQIFSLPLSRPGESTSSRIQAHPLPQLTPSDKTGTTLRLLLQDAQKTLEKFSDRLDFLFGDLERSRQSVTRVEKLFEESRERSAEEMRATVHLAKSELESKLDILHSNGTRSIHESLESLDKRLDTRITYLDDRLTTLDRKHDQLNLCVEKSSVVLGQVNLQLTQLLSTLGAVAALTPLFQNLNTASQDRENPINGVSQATSIAQTLVSSQIEEIIDGRKANKRAASSMDIDGPGKKFHQDENFTRARKRSKNSIGDGDQNSIDMDTPADFRAHEPTFATGRAYMHENSGESRREEIPSSDATVIPFSLAITGSSSVGEAVKRRGLSSGGSVVRQSSPPRHPLGDHYREGDEKRLIVGNLAGASEAFVPKKENTCANDKSNSGEEISAWKNIAEIGAEKSTGDGDDGPQQPLPGMMETETEDRIVGPVQVPDHDNTGCEVFQRLAIEEVDEEKEEESLDMSFIWGSLPDDETVSSF